MTGVGTEKPFLSRNSCFTQDEENQECVRFSEEHLQILLLPLESLSSLLIQKHLATFKSVSIKD